MPTVAPPTDALEKRTKELMGLGFKNFDALHVASAEEFGAEALCTCDDRFLATAKRQVPALKLRVLNPIELAREVLQ
jgi:predicted nucleic acid-binding protein